MNVKEENCSQCNAVRIRGRVRKVLPCVSFPTIVSARNASQDEKHCTRLLSLGKAVTCWVKGSKPLDSYLVVWGGLYLATVRYVFPEVRRVSGHCTY